MFNLYVACAVNCSLCLLMQGDLVFVKALLIKGFEVRDKVRTYLKQVGTRPVRL